MSGSKKSVSQKLFTVLVLTVLQLRGTVDLWWGHVHVGLGKSATNLPRANSVCTNLRTPEERSNQQKEVCKALKLSFIFLPALLHSLFITRSAGGLFRLLNTAP